MRRTCLVITVLLAFPLVLRAGDTAAKKPGDWYVVGIGQEDGWEFLPEGFVKALRDPGKGAYRELHARVLTGAKATRKELLSALDWACENAKADDLVFVFIACHGSCTASGESVFATRQGTVRPRDIKQVLAKLPCQAIVVNDACCSGNWPKELPGDPMPPNVTALCCCLSTQVSGIEFDITLFEALYGKADFNKDGVVELDEVIKYCGLRIKEVQGGNLTPVMHKAKSLKGPLPLTKPVTSLVSVIHNNEIFAGVLEKQDGDDHRVRVIGFNDKRGPFSIPNQFARNKVILANDGAALMVQNDGRWQPACLVSRDGTDFKIRFAATKDRDEIVPGERVRHVFAGNPGESFPAGLFRKR